VVTKSEAVVSAEGEGSASWVMPTCRVILARLVPVAVAVPTNARISSRVARLVAVTTEAAVIARSMLIAAVLVPPTVLTLSRGILAIRGPFAV